MDKLLFLLQNSRLGCHIENLFAGAIAYADDLIVLSVSVRHLQLILDLCVDLVKNVILYLIVISLNVGWWGNQSVN